jgi:SAM-dependent methyltransferase
MDSKQQNFGYSVRLWEFNAKADPLWAILSAPDKRGRKWDIDAFFKTGQGHIDAVWARLQHYQFVPRGKRALDFGCGVGRLTQPLAEKFEEVVGVDASARMIEQARGYNRLPKRVTFVSNPAPDLKLFADASFDFILSLIVMQHIPQDATLLYLREFLRVLAPGGTLVFQLPSGPSSTAGASSGGLKAKLKRFLPHRYQQVLRNLLRPHQPVIPMHPVPRATVEAVIAESGDIGSYIEPDGFAGPEWESFTYFLRRNPLK